MFRCRSSIQSASIITVFILLTVFVQVPRGDAITPASGLGKSIISEPDRGSLSRQTADNEAKETWKSEVRPASSHLDDPPPNDICENATLVLPNTSTPGTTIEATIDTPPILDSCGTSVTVPGVWYQIVGTGSELTVSVCDADYDTKISVFCGDCLHLYCVGGNDDFCGLQSLYRWCTSLDQTYWILIHGFGGQTGNFTLVVNEGSECSNPPACSDPPENIDCESALFIESTWVDGTTNGAPGDLVPDCSDYGLYSGVWYRIAGDGTEMTATTCDPATDSEFDSVIEIFCGTCDHLVCVASNDDDSDCDHALQSTVTWCSAFARDYWIRVSGLNEGNFRLLLESGTPCDDPVPCFEDCTPSVDVVTFDSQGEDPQYQCIFICPNQTVDIEVTPLYSGINIPVINMEMGCEIGCGIEGLSPTSPVISQWWYDEAANTWRTSLGVADGNDSGWVCISLDEILDVNLLSFEATNDYNEIQLKWRTGSELQNDRFEIMRDQKLVGVIRGAGSSQTTHDYVWTDDNVSGGRSYSYSLFSVSMNGERIRVGQLEMQATGVSIAGDHHLRQNYPNPFNAVTSIEFELNQDEFVQLRVYNSTGQLIATLVDEIRKAGVHEIRFNAASLSSGLYFCTLNAGDFKETRKMILLK